MSRKIGRVVVSRTRLGGLYNGGGVDGQFDPGNIVSDNLVHAPNEPFPDYDRFIGRRFGRVLVTRIVARALGDHAPVPGLYWRYWSIAVYGVFIGRGGRA